MTKELLENMIKGCKTDKQVLKVLDKNKVKYSDDTKESISFNLHLENNLRIYKNMRKEYVVQHWSKVEWKPTNVPTFFATNSYF